MGGKVSGSLVLWTMVRMSAFILIDMGYGQQRDVI